VDDEHDNTLNEAPIRVLIADDHALFRHGLEQALAAEPLIEVVGAAVDGIAAIEQALALAPDVVLMDVRMPGRTGVEAAEQILDARPDAKIVMLTGSDDEQDLFAAVRAGAAGYLLKEVSIEAVAGAVRAAHRGEGFVAPSLVPALLREFTALSRRIEDDDATGGEPKLTDREVEVLRLVARGMSNKEIARQLVIAENTVKNHVRNILEKLRLRSRTEAAMYAVREKLIEAS
jgi:DNA-binding NarL/FixJ family response regulator